MINKQKTTIIRKDNARKIVCDRTSTLKKDLASVYRTLNIENVSILIIKINCINFSGLEKLEQSNV